MNVIRCKNGHFFDGDSYDKCPHCGESAMAGGGNPTPAKEEKKGFWGRGKKDKDTVSSPAYSAPPVAQPRNIDNGDTPTESTGNSGSPAQSAPLLKKNPTLDFWQTSSHSESGSDSSQSQQEEAVAPAPEKKIVAPVASEDLGGQAEAVSSDSHEETHEVETDATSSLREAVRNASASNEGKTMSYFSSATAPSGNQSQPKQPSEPVVGWLVCVKGFHFGECFSIFAGKNSIGRSTENRIVIADDNSISRVKHALIVYEPKKRNFYLQPGDSSGLTYLNDDYITESHLLSSHDMIELGDSKFLFVPLCGEKFTWEDHMPKGE